MNLKNTNQSKISRASISRASKRTIALVAMILLVVGGIVAFALEPPSETGAYDLLITSTSQLNQAGGFCSSQSTTGPQICREWCFTSEDGTIIPQGQFVCVDQ
jgi:hypothetical protein